MESVQRQPRFMAAKVDEGEDRNQAVHNIDLIRIAIVGLAAVATWFHLWRPLPQFDLIGLAAAVVGGYPIYHEAIEALRQRRMTMELSMTIAIVAALAIGEFFTALVIILFVLVAEILENLTVGRGRRAIKDLLDVLPREATVRRGRSEARVHLNELQVNEVVLIMPGERLPVDGIVLAGHSFVDEASITGESLPTEKTAGSSAYAGTINQSGILEIRTSGVGRNTAFGRIVEAVERAEQSKAPVQKIADRLAGYLVYFALGCAALTLLITHNARATISVVIVAGACGIAAGTPLAILGGIGRAARLGAIIKGGLYLEALSEVDTVVLDKTGTVTFGNPEVVATCRAPGVDERLLIETAAIAERRSEHPLAKAILSRFGTDAERLPTPDTFAYTPGKGITCSLGAEQLMVGNRTLMAEQNVDVRACPPPEKHYSEVLVARGGKVLGALHVADVLRPEAIKAIERLRSMRLRTILLTGDAAVIASAIAKQLGVDEVTAELLPEQKRSRIEALIREGHKVAMLGDGINDAPALTQATVGIAMGSGTDVARESANVVLIGNDLGKFVETIGIARWCRQIIRQNFVGTISVDGAGVLLAALGLLNPLFAAFIHVTSELAFILNSTRLLPRRRSPSSPAFDTKRGRAPRTFATSPYPAPPPACGRGDSAKLDPIEEGQ